MSQSMNDALPGPTGHFLMQVFRAGELIETFSEKNLIVDGSKTIHAKLLGGTVANNSITQVAFGTNGTTPAGGNTAITSPFTKAIDSVTYPAANQVAFNFSLASSEANGKALLEFGLLTAAGALYARKIRATALNKDTDISLTVTWTITF